MWKNLMCKFGWHEWSKWSTPKPVYGIKSLVFEGVQYRTCLHCGIVETNPITIMSEHEYQGEDEIAGDCW